MKFRVIVPGESSMYEVDQQTALKVGDKITLGSGKELQVHAIMYDPLGDPESPQFLLQAS